MTIEASHDFLDLETDSIRSREMLPSRRKMYLRQKTT